MFPAAGCEEERGREWGTAGVAMGIISVSDTVSTCFIAPYAALPVKVGSLCNTNKNSIAICYSHTKRV